MLKNLTIAELNTRVEIAREAIINPAPLGGLTISETAALHLESLVALMDELHARAMTGEGAPVVECFDSKGRPASYPMLPRTVADVARNAEIKKMVEASYAAKSVCPF